MKTNHNKSMAIIIFFTLSVSVFSQQKIDDAKYRASYLFSYKTEETQDMFSKKDLMYLDIGNSNTKFYSRYEQVRDSVASEDIRKGLSAYEIVENKRLYKKGLKIIVYGLADNNQFVTTEGLVGYYQYSEQRTLPTWKIDTVKKEIAGYNCQKASARYLDREWIVYFTTEIPINQGPWKLWGLPGLIVEAKDKDNLFSFELEGFEVIKEEKSILFQNKTLTGKPYVNISKKKLQELETIYYKDPLEFIKLFVLEGRGSIHQTKEQEQQYQALKGKGGEPYIPLEPY